MPTCRRTWTIPALRLDIDRTRASELGLNQHEVVDNVITALTSNGMIAPSYWIDPKTGNDYMLTVQYPENQIASLSDLSAIPLKAAGNLEPTRLNMISSLRRINSPTEVDHYQLRRTIDIYVRPQHEDLGKIANNIDGIIAKTRVPEGLSVTLRGSVQGMRDSFTQLRCRPLPRGGASLPDPCGPVPVVHRPVHHTGRRTAGTWPE